jgi:hypothetical protein
MHLTRTSALCSTLGALLCVASGCRSSPQQTSRRVDALLAVYAPGLRFGQLANEVDTLVPMRGVRQNPSDARSGTDKDGFAIQAVRVRYTWKHALAEQFGRPAISSRGRVRAVVLMAADSTAAQKARERVTAVFGHAPDEGCAGLPGVSLDRVFYWKADDRGGVALTVPAFRERDAPWAAQLVLYAGEWDPERTVEIGFRSSMCPATPTAAR